VSSVFALRAAAMLAGVTGAAKAEPTTVVKATAKAICFSFISSSFKILI
jgi:hypothetical protein